MDESTRQRMELKQSRETDVDYAIGLTEYNYGTQLKISWLDIINYCCDKAKLGVSKIIIKEKFLQEVVDPKIAEINIDLSQIDIDMEKECASYNY